jgi:hypothetical protein
MAPLADPADMQALARAVKAAATDLELVQLIRKVEGLTDWEGPGRRRYDERSREAQQEARRFAEDLGAGARKLVPAADRLVEEVRRLRRDEENVRRFAREYKGPSSAGVVPSPTVEAIVAQVRADRAPPGGDPTWAWMARQIFGRSESRAPG